MSDRQPGPEAENRPGAGGDPSGPDDALLPLGDAPAREPRWLRRALITIGALGLVLALLVGGGVWFLTSRYVAPYRQRVRSTYDPVRCSALTTFVT